MPSVCECVLLGGSFNNASFGAVGADAFLWVLVLVGRVV